MQYDEDNEKMLEPLDAGTLLLGPRQVQKTKLRLTGSGQSMCRAKRRRQLCGQKSVLAVDETCLHHSRAQSILASSAQLPILRGTASCIPASDIARMGTKISPLLDVCTRSFTRLSRVELRLLENAVGLHGKDFTAACDYVNRSDQWNQEPLHISKLTLWFLPPCITAYVNNGGACHC